VTWPPRPVRGAPVGGPSPARPPRPGPVWRRAAGRWRPGRCGYGRCGAWPPAGPASSVTRRSTAVWMSSSAGNEHERPVGQLAFHGRRGRPSTADASSRRGAALPDQTSHVGARSGDVVEAKPLVVGQGDGVGHQLGGRPGREPAVPERPLPQLPTRTRASIRARADVRARGGAGALVLGHDESPSADLVPWRAAQVCTPSPQSRTKPGRVLVAERSAAS
jgi:hypothetical protein